MFPQCQSNRTTDGRPICNICRNPGHNARFCKSRNEQYPRAVNALHTIGMSKKRSALEWHKGGSINRYWSSSYRCLRAICEWMCRIQMRLDRSRNFPRKRRNDMVNLRNPRQHQHWTERGKRRSHRNAVTKYRYPNRERSAETVR